MAKKRVASDRSDTASRRKPPGRNGSRPASGNGKLGPATRSTTEQAAAPGSNRTGNADDARPLPRTHLNDRELEHFRGLLLDKRRELVGDVQHMEDEALRRTRSDAAGDLSMMPIHMADIGTDNYEQEFTIGLIAGERGLLKEIDAALQRIENKTYGVCLATHQPIGLARLRIKPWASYCVEYERSQETNGRRRT